MSQSRQPKGIPVGGQFAATFRGESEVRLSDPENGRWYHGSLVPLTVGDMLTPQPKKARNFSASKSVVSLTENWKTAAYWAREVAKKRRKKDPEANGQVYIYEVEPVGDLTPWRHDGEAWAEAHAQQARITKVAFGLLGGRHVDDLPDPETYLGQTRFVRHPEDAGWVKAEQES